MFVLDLKKSRIRYVIVCKHNRKTYTKQASNNEPDWCSFVIILTFEINCIYTFAKDTYSYGSYANISPYDMKNEFCQANFVDISNEKH